MKKAILRFFASVAQKWWAFWSNIRFRKSERFSKEILEEDKINDLDDIRRICPKLYSHFRYKNDGLDQLFDAVITPPQAYKNYLTSELEDDCDGFHALLMHVLKCNNIKCYLLSVIAWKNGHCILVMKYNDLWYTADYTHVYQGFKTLDESVKNYNREFPIKYNIKYEVYYNGLIDYDYEKGKFRNASFKKAEKD